MKSCTSWAPTRSRSIDRLATSRKCIHLNWMCVAVDIRSSKIWYSLAPQWAIYTWRQFPRCKRNKPIISHLNELTRKCWTAHTWKATASWSTVCPAQTDNRNKSYIEKKRVMFVFQTQHYRQRKWRPKGVPKWSIWRIVNVKLSHRPLM